MAKAFKKSKKNTNFYGPARALFLTQLLTCREKKRKHSWIYIFICLCDLKNFRSDDYVFDNIMQCNMVMVLSSILTLFTKVDVSQTSDVAVSVCDGLFTVLNSVLKKKKNLETSNIQENFPFQVICLKVVQMVNLVVNLPP